MRLERLRRRAPGIDLPATVHERRELLHHRITGQLGHQVGLGRVRHHEGIYMTQVGAQHLFVRVGHHVELFVAHELARDPRRLWPGTGLAPPADGQLPLLALRDL